MGVTFCRIALWDRFGKDKAFILDITNLRRRLGKNSSPKQVHGRTLFNNDPV